MNDISDSAVGGGDSPKAKTNIGNNSSGDILPLMVPDDDENTMMHTHIANAVIRRLNSIWSVKGINGITIEKADANMVIGYDPEKKDDKNKDPNQGTPSSSSINYGSGSTVIFNCTCRYA